MIFDLKSGKRRRVVQVVFGGLALLFAVGFVGFGIGGETGGGIADLLGDDSGGDPSSVYEQQIEDAQKKLDENPKDPKALTDLARYHFLAGQDALSLDEEAGIATITEEARAEWNDALDAWEALLRTEPKQVDVQVAGQMVCAYVPPYPVCGIQAPPDLLNLKGAAATQEVLAEQEDDSGAYGQLAAFHFYDGNLKAGEDAKAKALELAKPDQRGRIRKELDRLQEDAEKYAEQQKKAEKGGGGKKPQLENPFGDLGGDLGAAPIPQASP